MSLISCDNLVLSEAVESGQDIDVYASINHTNSGSSTSEYFEVQIKQNGSIIQLSNGIVKVDASEMTFSSTKKAYVLDGALTTNQTYTFSIILNQGETNEKSYTNTTIKFLGVPDSKAKLGSTIGSVGSDVAFPTTMAATNGILTITSDNYTLNGSVFRSDGTSSDTNTYSELNNRYFSPYFMSGSDKFQTSSVTFELKYESAGSLDSSFNGGSAKGKVNLSKAITITR